MYVDVSYLITYRKIMSNHSYTSFCLKMQPFFQGTYILSLEESLEKWKKGEGLDSVYGSSKIVDEFNVKYEVYEDSLDIEKYLDPSITLEISKQ